MRSVSTLRPLQDGLRLCRWARVCVHAGCGAPGKRETWSTNQQGSTAGASLAEGLSRRNRRYLAMLCPDLGYCPGPVHLSLRPRLWVSIGLSCEKVSHF